MRTDYENEIQQVSPLESDEKSNKELNSQESPEPVSDSEEELFFWSEPGVCG